ncbi:MAG TPA: beta-propeller fold lactonase family protein [Candidatus Sulfotelmatobacter sp.]|nr:beta-propeller fold lactonase family protein [Candidatus Sulfotelmatobacter sp.]
MRLFSSASLFVAIFVLAACSGSPKSTTQTGGATTTTNPPQGNNVVAYVFTTDSLTNTASEFALLNSGRLQPTAVAVPDALPVPTAHGVVFPVPGHSGGLQSYILGSDGSLQAAGSPATFPVNQFFTLASDTSFVYAASDEGVSGFQDQESGLTPLAATQQTVKAPCTAAQEAAAQCYYSAAMALGTSTAFLLEQATPVAGQPNGPQLSAFTQVQGRLTAEQSVAQALAGSIFAPTPDGRFIYVVDLASSRIFRYAANGNGAFATNILANGQQVSDGFVQLLVSADGAFLLAAVSDQATNSNIRVFQIDSASGDLTEVSGSPFPTGETAFTQMALDPTGHYLLAAHAVCMNSGSSNCTIPGKLVAMSISSTGNLSLTSDVADGVYPAKVTAAPISQ